MNKIISMPDMIWCNPATNLCASKKIIFQCSNAINSYECSSFRHLVDIKWFVSAWAAGQSSESTARWFSRFIHLFRSRAFRQVCKWDKVHAPCIEMATAIYLADTHSNIDRKSSNSWAQRVRHFFLFCLIHNFYMFSTLLPTILFIRHCYSTVWIIRYAIVVILTGNFIACSFGSYVIAFFSLSFFSSRRHSTVAVWLYRNVKNGKKQRHTPHEKKTNHTKNESRKYIQFVVIICWFYAQKSSRILSYHYSIWFSCCIGWLPLP